MASVAWQGSQGSLLDDRFADFMDLADKLDMPGAERAGILDVFEGELVMGPSALRAREAEVLRRLTYAIGLMQRQLQNL